MDRAVIIPAHTGHRARLWGGNTVQVRALWEGIQGSGFPKKQKGPVPGYQEDGDWAALDLCSLDWFSAGLCLFFLLPYFPSRDFHLACFCVFSSSFFLSREFFFLPFETVVSNKSLLVFFKLLSYFKFPLPQPSVCISAFHLGRLVHSISGMKTKGGIGNSESLACPWEQKDLAKD